MSDEKKDDIPSQMERELAAAAVAERYREARAAFGILPDGRIDLNRAEAELARIRDEGLVPIVIGRDVLAEIFRKGG